jgi:hypothetical protein
VNFDKKTRYEDKIMAKKIELFGTWFKALDRDEKIALIVGFVVFIVFFVIMWTLGNPIVGLILGLVIGVILGVVTQMIMST